MIIIPEIETVVVLVPRTGTRSLKKAIAVRYPQSVQLYRHMEADGVPTGYDRWRRLGVVRNPIDRLWSVYRFLSTMVGAQDHRGKWEPCYVERQRRSGSMPFNDWIVDNDIVFTSPYDSSGSRFWPGFCVKHSLPENRKSQFIYLRPDLGTEVYQFSDLHLLSQSLDLNLGHEHRLPNEPYPALDNRSISHIERFFAWDLQVTSCGQNGGK